jgi:hypothetical protein
MRRYGSLQDAANKKWCNGNTLLVSKTKGNKMKAYRIFREAVREKLEKSWEKQHALVSQEVIDDIVEHKVDLIVRKIVEDYFDLTEK